MAAIHLVSDGDADFPYDQVREALLAVVGIETGEIDFAGLIKNAAANQWPMEIMEKYREQQDSGKCFTFIQKQTPLLKGEMYDTNVRFIFDDDEHKDACMPIIDELATKNSLKQTMAL